MIQANELRIGNWVYQNQRNDFVRIDGGDIWNIQSNIITEKDIKPIPLTPEILEKAGFKESLISKDYIYKGFMMLHKTEGYMCSPFDFMKKVTYVHELQNLYFALTGEELNIEL